MKFFRDLILAVLAGLLVILALEAGMRLARQRSNAALFQLEWERGFSLLPNAEGWNTQEGFAYIRTNSDGMRDKERPFRRPAGTLRVAVLGSSYVEAVQVPLELTFESEMQRQLSPALQAQGNRIDVLNFGVVGFTQAQQYLTLHNHVWKYDPEVVVVVWNQYEFLKNTRETDPEVGERDVAPYYAIHGGRLEPIEPLPAKKSLRYPDPRKIATLNRIDRWMNSSYLLGMLNRAHMRWKDQEASFRTTLRAITGSSAVAASNLAQDYQLWWPYQPYLPEVQEDWALAEAFLREMKQECDRHGAEMLVVISDGEIQSNPDVAARGAFVRRYGLMGLNESDVRLERLCQSNGIRVLPLAPPMGEYAAAHGIVLHGVHGEPASHWNKLGHRIAGRLIAAELRTRSSVIQAWAAGRREL